MAAAGSGLESIPFHFFATEKHSDFIFERLARQAHFQLEGASGSYTQCTLSFGFPFLGFQLSAVRLTQERHGGGTSERRSSFGFENPLLFSRWRLHSSDNTTVDLGSQLEIPIGADRSGIASDHAESVSYLALGRALGATRLWACAGLRLPLTSGHELTPLVNPHERKEYLYRAEVGRGSSDSKLSARLFLDGQIAAEGKDGHFLSAGGTLRFRLGGLGGYVLAPTFEIPLTPGRRFDWKLSFRLLPTLWFAFN